MPFVQTAPDVRVHYRTFGSEGPVVVLLQGLGLSGDFWFDVPERVAAHAQGRSRVLVPDNRGVGKSSLPSRPFAMEDMADDIAAVLDAEGAERAVVVGISMGGMIAQRLALRHPHRVEGLVLMATSAGGLRMRPPAPHTVATLLSVPFGRGKSTNQQALMRLVLPKSQVSQGKLHLKGWGPAFKENPIRPRAFFSQLGAVATHLLGADLSQIRCPTVVVTGDDDVLIPKRNAELLADGIPHAHLEVLENTGHGVTLLDPEVVPRNIARVRNMRRVA